MQEYLLSFVPQNVEQFGFIGAQMRIYTETPEEAATELFNQLQLPTDQLPKTIWDPDRVPTMGYFAIDIEGTAPTMTVGDFAVVYNPFNDSDVTYLRRLSDGWERVSKEVVYEDIVRVERELRKKINKINWDFLEAD